LARAISIGGAARKPPADGLYRSADAVTPAPLIPPVTSTRPSYRSTEDAPARPLAMSPVGAQVLEGTCGADALIRNVDVDARSATTAARTNGRFMNCSWKTHRYRLDVFEPSKPPPRALFAVRGQAAN